jgi:RNA polymerase sigma factor (sigma-70 family)
MPLPARFTQSLLTEFEPAYAHLLRVARRSTGCAETARDLVHDAWVRLAEQTHAAQAPAADAAPGVQPEALRNPTAYLTTLAQHLAMDQHRKDRLQADYLQDAATHQHFAPRRVPDAAEHLMYRQALLALEQALATLPERARTAFVAHRVHGEAQADIAQRLGVALNTVERDLMLAHACVEDALHRWRGTAPASTRTTQSGATRTGTGPGAEPHTARPMPRRRSLAALLSVAALGCSGTLAWQLWQTQRADAARWQAAQRSGRGQLPRYTLPDGSTLQLDALSHTSVTLTARARKVALHEGAAFFSVTHDAERPFVVEAGAVRVTVLGTRFGVERLPGTAGVLVQVESGRVQVQPGPGQAAEVLGAGEALRIAPSGLARREQALDAVAPWRRGELVFADTPLGLALERLQRYSPAALVATGAAADLPVSGLVRVAHAQAWLRALPLALPVRLQPQGDGGMRVEMAADAPG